MATCLLLWLKFPFGLPLTWVKSIGSVENARMRRLALTFGVCTCYNGSAPTERFKCKFQCFEVEDWFTIPICHETCKFEFVSQNCNFVFLSITVKERPYHVNKKNLFATTCLFILYIFFYINWAVSWIKQLSKWHAYFTYVKLAYSRTLFY